jgi:hypothetical protein
VADVSRDFRVSRKSRLNIFRQHGCEAFSDHPRWPVRYANQLLRQVEGLIVSLGTHNSYVTFPLLQSIATLSAHPAPTFSLAV